MAIAAATAATIAGPANAAEYSWGTSPRGATASFDPSTLVSSVCDVKADGKYAVLYFKTSSGAYLNPQYDYGSSAGCSLRRMAFNPGRVIYGQVCLKDSYGTPSACSSWKKFYL